MGREQIEQTLNRLMLQQDRPVNTLFAAMLSQLPQEVINEFLQPPYLLLRLVTPIVDYQDCQGVKVYDPSTVHNGNLPFILCSGYATINIFRECLNKVSKKRTKSKIGPSRQPLDIQHSDYPPPYVTLCFPVTSLVSSDDKYKEVVRSCGLGDLRDLNASDNYQQKIEPGVDLNRIVSAIEQVRQKATVVAWCGSGSAHPNHPYGFYYEVPQFYATRVEEGLTEEILRPTTIMTEPFRDLAITFTITPSN